MPAQNRTRAAGRGQQAAPTWVGQCIPRCQQCRAVHARLSARRQQAVAAPPAVAALSGQHPPEGKVARLPTRRPSIRCGSDQASSKLRYSYLHQNGSAGGAVNLGAAAPAAAAKAPVQARFGNVGAARKRRGCSATRSPGVLEAQRDHQVGGGAHRLLVDVDAKRVPAAAGAKMRTGASGDDGDGGDGGTPHLGPRDSPLGCNLLTCCIPWAA